MALTPIQKKLHLAKMGNLQRDMVIVGCSVVITLLALRMGFLEELLTLTEESAYIGSFIAGIFFTSVFTIAPASIVLAEMTNVIHPLNVALWGALGAMIGDLVLFLFIRDVFSDDIESLPRVRKWKKKLSRPHLGFMRWLLPIIGALIIASPLPDELGIALLGMSRTKTTVLLPIAFTMNFLGVLLIAYAATQIQ